MMHFACERVSKINLAVKVAILKISTTPKCGLILTGPRIPGAANQIIVI